MHSPGLAMHEPKQAAIGVHRPGAARLRHREAGLVVAVEKLLAWPARQLVSEREGDGVAAMPVNIDNLYGTVGQHPNDERTLRQVLELRHAQSPSPSYRTGQPYVKTLSRLPSGPGSRNSAPWQ
jgi:hypothetical protein